MASYQADFHGHAAVLTIPGLNGSGPSHWQSLWEDSRVDTTRVDLGMWTMPHRNAWVTKIDQAVRGAGANPRSSSRASGRSTSAGATRRAPATGQP